MNHLLHSGVYPLNEKLSGLLLVTFSVSVCQDLEAVVQTYSVKKVVLRDFAKSRGKHLGRSLFLNEVAGLRPAALFKKRP